jgi:hypothetical protein
VNCKRFARLLFRLCGVRSFPRRKFCPASGRIPSVRPLLGVSRQTKPNWGTNNGMKYPPPTQWDLSGWCIIVLKGRVAGMPANMSPASFGMNYSDNGSGYCALYCHFSSSPQFDSPMTRTGPERSSTDPQPRIHWPIRPEGRRQRPRKGIPFGTWRPPIKTTSAVPRWFTEWAELVNMRFFGP